MKYKLCLHGLEVKNQAQLLNLAKRLLPGSTVKVKIKEKYFNDNDMYKYRLTRFTPENIDGVRLYCAWGTLLVSDKLLAIADIIIEFEYHNAEAAEAVDSLLQKLLTVCCRSCWPPKQNLCWRSRIFRSDWTSCAAVLTKSSWRPTMPTAL